MGSGTYKRRRCPGCKSATVSPTGIGLDPDCLYSIPGVRCRKCNRSYAGALHLAGPGRERTPEIIANRIRALRHLAEGMREQAWRLAEESVEVDAIAKKMEDG